MEREGKKSHGFRNVLIGIILGALICAGGLYVYWQMQPSHGSSGSKTRIDLQVLKESMEKNNELSTAKYLYTAEEAITDQNTLEVVRHPEITLPFTDAIYILHFDGTIKAGFDLNEAEVTKDGENKIIVTLPAAKILSDEIGEVEVTYKSENIMNPLRIGEETEWITSQKSVMEERAIKLGLYTEAQENAKETFSTLFALALPSGCDIEIKFK